MTRTRLLAMLFILAVAGFALGRWSAGTLPESETVSDGASGMPLFPAPPKPEDELTAESGGLVIETPAEGSYVPGDTLEVSGRAKVEGGALRIVIKDSAGTEIAAEPAEISPEAGGFGRFSKTFAFAIRPTGRVSVEISRTGGDGPAGVRNVTFDQPAEGGATIAMDVFFHNPELGAADECTGVFPVSRPLPTGVSAYRAALEALLQGPDDAERAKGYATTIPSAAVLKSVAADAAGIVTAEFSSALERGVAGSCRVGAIRTQIERTLTQFPEVRGVVISVDGRIEDALQP